MRKWIRLAVGVAVGVTWYLVLPPAPVTLAPSATGAMAPMRGAIHVHTRRSDGTGTVDEVAAAARRAGLQFVIFTDHGDGTRGSDTPVYRFGVLCIDAVEISTNGGHVVALGLPQTPFPLAGEAGDVIEDIRRMGGMSIAAHPDSPRAELRWNDWDAPFDGVEWLNGDSEWRDEGWGTLSRTLFTYPFRRAATLAAVLDRPDDILNRWDTLSRSRSVVAIAAADAHARVGPGGDPYGRSLSLHLPSYEQSFRTVSISLPQVQLHGNASEDAAVVLDAIRNGRVFSTIDAIARPATFAFTATSGSHQAAMGDRLSIDGPVMLRVETTAPEGSSIRLIAEGKTVASAAPPVLEYTAPPTPSVYRVEIDTPGAPGLPPIPWLVSNPLYVGQPTIAETSSQASPAPETVALYSNGPATDWRIEKSVRSEGTIGVARGVDGTQLLLRYGLGGTLSESPYVAAVVTSNSDLARYSGVMFTARAMRPMRITFQLRAPGATDRRWGRSVYLDDTARSVTIPFDRMLPLGVATGGPALQDIRDLLFVVDTVHAKQGSSGQVWLDEIRYVR
jgi:hypothetical protein